MLLGWFTHQQFAFNSTARVPAVAVTASGPRAVDLLEVTRRDKSPGDLSDIGVIDSVVITTCNPGVNP